MKWFYLVSSEYNRVFNNDGKDAAPHSTTKATKYENGVSTTTVEKTVAARVIKGKTYLFGANGAMLTGVYHFDGPVNCSGGQALQDGFYYFSKNGGSAEGRMEKGRTAINYDGDIFTYYFNKNGKACTNELNDGAVYNHRGVSVEAKDGNANQVFSIKDDISGNKGLKLGNYYYTDGSIVVSSTGKIRTGSAVIDDVKYEISNYVVVKAYDRHDKEKNNLQSMFVPARRETRVYAADGTYTVTKTEESELNSNGVAEWVEK